MIAFLEKIILSWRVKTLKQALTLVLPSELVEAGSSKYPDHLLLEGIAMDNKLNGAKLLKLLADRLRLPAMHEFDDNILEKLESVPEKYRSLMILPHNGYYVVANPYDPESQSLLKDGNKLALALPSTIKAAWDRFLQSKSLSAGARKMLEYLANDVIALGGSEVVLGSPAFDSYTFNVEDRCYQGKLHPGVLGEVLKVMPANLEIECQGVPRKVYFAKLGSSQRVRISGLLEDAESLSDTVEEEITDKLQRDALLVEDDDRFAFILEEALKSKELIVHRVSSVKEALTWLRTNSVLLVICDLNMPEQDGREFVLRLRELDPELGVIMLTSEESKEVKTELLDLGATAYVRKNDDPRLLLAWVHNIMEKTRRPK